MLVTMEGVFLGSQISEFTNQETGEVEKTYQIGINQGLDLAKFYVEELDYQMYKELPLYVPVRAVVTPRAYNKRTGEATLTFRLEAFELLDGTVPKEAEEDKPSSKAKEGGKK